MKPALKHTWETFLRVADPSTADPAPDADPAFLVSRGIEVEAPIVLRHMRRDVLPLVRRLERWFGLEWFCFLVHDLESGVPTSTEGRYIHLRLSFRELKSRRQVLQMLPAPWVMTRKFVAGEIGGTDSKIIDVRDAWRFIGRQSDLYLDLIEPPREGRRQLRSAQAREAVHALLRKHVADEDQLMLLTTYFCCVSVISVFGIRVYRDYRMNIRKPFSNNDPWEFLGIFWPIGICVFLGWFIFIVVPRFVGFRLATFPVSVSVNGGTPSKVRARSGGPYREKPERCPACGKIEIS